MVFVWTHFRRLNLDEGGSLTFHIGSSPLGVNTNTLQEQSVVRYKSWKWTKSLLKMNKNLLKIKNIKNN